MTGLDFLLLVRKVFEDYVFIQVQLNIECHFAFPLIVSNKSLWELLLKWGWSLGKMSKGLFKTE